MFDEMDGISSFIRDNVFHQTCTAVLIGRLYCRYCINTAYIAHKLLENSVYSIAMTFRLQQGRRVIHPVYLFLFSLIQRAQMSSLCIICRLACTRVAVLNACCCTNSSPSVSRLVSVAPIHQAVLEKTGDSSREIILNKSKEAFGGKPDKSVDHLCIKRSKKGAMC